ncbi:glycosyltransferase [Halobacillus campisalis]|uniref:Glycosyltransferase n=1 Tax=Halobacillus campisalis TaxID=435909 RepID=A0ABW2JXT2_9BACI|nr:glycosyltransferase [Halobacillus campisalis]
MKKKKKILIMGNYGKDDRLTGQSTRTRTVTKSIKKYLNDYNVTTVDTSNKKFRTIISAFIGVLTANKVIIMPAQNGLKPVLYMIKLLFACSKTSYVAIGGWLVEHIRDEDRLIKVLKDLSSVNVQMQSMKGELEKLGMNNVNWFPNYRILENENRVTPIGKSGLKNLVFYSRVRKDKGVLIAIEAVNAFNKLNEEKIQLDIYGPIEIGFENEFYTEIKSGSYIKYKGVLKEPNIISTISKYDCMVFPTYYVGEGFPGAVLESFISGVPVIASDWKYNTQIVSNDTGLICKVNSIESLLEKITELHNHPELLQLKQKKCLEEASKYTEEQVVPTLVNSLKTKY